MREGVCPWSRIPPSMRLLLASLVIGWAMVGALQGCSSSSSPSSPAGGEDAGARDGTTAEGGGGHDAQVDVFAATAGGLAANEPGVDVALALAVASAVMGFAVAPTVVALGEVGLAGELRPVSGLTRRVGEASRLGATVVIVPSDGDLEDVAGVTVLRCSSLVEAIDAAQRVGGSR